MFFKICEVIGKWARLYSTNCVVYVHKTIFSEPFFKILCLNLSAAHDGYGRYVERLSTGRAPALGGQPG